MAPTAFEIGHYGIEGIDDHSAGSPSDGVHLSIEANWTGAPYAARQGTNDFTPNKRWIAGGQRWNLGDLAAGQSSNFDIALSLLTGTKVVRDGGGNQGGGSCNGGSSHAGGVDFEFDDISVEGTFFGDYSEADDNEMAERENEGDFALPSFPRPEGSTFTQLWNLEYSGSHSGLIHLTFAYNPSLLPAGFNENRLAIHHFNGSVWEKLDGIVDPVANTITASTTSLSPFALGVKLPPVADPASAALNAEASSALGLTGSSGSRQPVAFEILTEPSHGLLSGFNPATGAVTYTPSHGFSGTDHFTFRVTAGGDNSDPAMVSISIAAPADSDADGMPNEWEQTHFADPTGGDPDIDSDGDGLTNAQEYSANSNPVDAASSMRCSGVTCDANGHLTFAWASVGGVRYRIQYSDNLAAGFTDIVLPISEETETSPAGSPATRSFTDDFTRTGGAPGNGARFYRVKVVP